MQYMSYFYLLLDRDFMVVALSGVATFATIITLGLPYLKGDPLEDRMKAVADRREELRRKAHEALVQQNRRGQLRSTPIGFMKRTVDNFNLEKLTQSPGMKEKLVRAGFRGQAPVIAFMFFRFVMPPVLFLGALVYLFGISALAWSFNTKLLAAVAAAALGYYSPDLYVSNCTQKRRESIMRAFPDALDLMLICVESGMSIESAFNKVAQEVGTQSADLAEELALTTAELSYLPDRKQAFQNLAERCGHSGVKAVAAALIQSEKYGTPMGQALRVAALENREMRMSEAERKAAALPSKLTVPMMAFFMPALFIVILGPVAIQVMGMK
jgi:tight adherence protein C